jgi:hypothetical protein
MILENNQRIKSLGADLDFGFDFTDWLAEGESIVSHEVVYVDDALTITDDMIVDGFVIFYVSGGELGRWHDIRIRITTDATPKARIEEATMEIYVTQK